ncbi:MAG: Uma2 family endonuclease [Gemmataceae bacterium]
MPREPETWTATDVYYPTSDGTPVAETETHMELLFAVRERLKAWYADRSDVYVGANMFVYYEEGNPAEVLAPDCFVAFGVPNRVRDLYRTWEEGVFPTVVFEFTSRKTRRDDLTTKFAVYQDVWRVKEYFLYDPYAEYLKPPLRGFRRSRGRLMPLKPSGGSLTSATLGLTLTPDGARLQLCDAATGAELMTLAELAAANERAARTAADERAAAAEAEVARLKAELAALRKKKPTA